MRLSKTDISVWLISGFALTGLTLLFMGAVNAPSSPYRLVEETSQDTVKFEDFTEAESPLQDPNLVVLDSDSLN